MEIQELKAKLGVIKTNQSAIPEPVLVDDIALGSVMWESIDVSDLDMDDSPTHALANNQHPAPWWFRLLRWAFPNRCREVPEAQNPGRILLRQFAIIKYHCYLQQFASGEDPEWMHSHQFKRVVAIGLWGAYTEWRMAGPPRKRSAPYLYSMGCDVVHHVMDPSKGHTSIFFGWGRDEDLKEYFPTGQGVLWSDHIKVMVKRI